MEKFDFAIIGAGGAGLAAGMYSARLGLKTVIFGETSGRDLPVGGLITVAHTVENYPGFKSISGLDLAKKIEEHTKNYPSTKIKREKVIEIKKNKDCFFLKTNKGDYQATTILFATGRRIRKLEIPSAKKFENLGVNYCALCDGPLYKDKIVSVFGGGDSAVVEALVLSIYAKKVFIIYRGEKIKAEPINLDKIKYNKKIEVITNTNILEIKGDKFVNKITLDNSYKGKKELTVDAVYVSIGNDPISELAGQIGVKLNDKKEIIVNHMNSSTNLPGVYAAGDVTDKPFKQLIIGVSEGVLAAHSAYDYISKKNIDNCK
jgi:thioredoxin reductase (NADPH)